LEYLLLINVLFTSIMTQSWNIQWHVHMSRCVHANIHWPKLRYQYPLLQLDLSPGKLLKI